MWCGSPLADLNPVDFVHLWDPQPKLRAEWLHRLKLYLNAIYKFKSINFLDLVLILVENIEEKLEKFCYYLEYSMLY